MLRKSIHLILLICLLTSLFTAAVQAEEKSFQIAIGQKIDNCVFQIKWENADSGAAAVIKSPGGKEFSKQVTPELFTETSGSIVVYIGEAEAGNWNVSVTGEALGKVTVSGGELPEYLLITKFDATKTSDDRITVSWKAKDTSGSILYSVYADTHNNGRNGTEIATFYDAAEGTREITINNLSTGDYYFYLRAQDANLLPDYRYNSSKIHIRNMNVTQTVQGVSASIINDDVFVRWQKSDNIDTYRVVLYKSGTDELVFTEETQNDWYAYPAPSGIKAVDVGVAAVINGISGDYKKIKVDLGVNFDAKVGLPDKKYLNIKKLVVPVEFTKDLKLDVFVNNVYFIVGADKPGDYAVTMEDGENHIGFVLTDSKGNKKSFEKIYYVDTYPPQLQLLTDLDGKRVTSPKVAIAGKTEAAASLEINGKKVPVNKEGAFNYKLGLVPGTNKVVIAARDVAGNESQIVVRVTFDIFFSYLFYLALGLVLFAAISVYYLTVFLKAGRKGRKQDNGGGDAVNDPKQGDEPK